MALTQIHGGRQILDGTIRDAELAADAAIANSKLDLASIAQAVTLAHAAGLRVENAQGAAVVQRNTNVAVESGGLYRLIIDGNGVLRVQRNTTTAGNFGATADPLQIRDVAVRLFDASLELRESAQVLPAGLWRLAVDGNSLKVQQNTANAGDFSTVKAPMQFGTGGDGVVINDTIAIIGRSLLNMNGSEPRIQLAQNASPTEQNIVFRGTDDRLHWKTAVADNPLAYLSDITTITTPDIHEGGVKITGLATPGAPTVTPQGTAGTSTWGYKITAVGVNGETLGSVEGTTNTGNAVLDATNFNRITWTAVSEAKSYNIYRTTAGGTPATAGKIGNTTATTFDDTGLAATGGTPTADTSDIVLVEHTDPQLRLRETDQGITAGGLQRIRLIDRALSFEINTAAGGDFSAQTLAMNISTQSGDVEIFTPFRVNQGTKFQSASGANDFTLRRSAADGDRLRYQALGGATDRLLAYTVDDVNHRITKAVPAFEWRDTNVALPLGLWRLRGLNDELRLDENLAAAGDFSTHEPRLRIAGNLTVAVHGRLRIENPLAGPSGAIAASIQWVDAVVPTNLVANSLFRSSTDSRLHVKDNASVDQTLAYLSDIVSPGNTVLVSEYMTKETPAGAVNGVNTTFTLAFTPEPGTEQVYLNGLLQSPGATEDYTISGATITFSSAPVAGDKIRVSYIKA